MDWNPNCTRPEPFRFRTHKDRDRDVVRPARVHLYVNGDEHDMGFDVIVNRREYPHWYALLDALTRKIGAKRPVEALYTLDGRRVNGFKDLRRKGEYVVVVGHDAFEPLSYGEADSTLQDWRRAPVSLQKRSNDYDDPEALDSRASLKIYIQNHHCRHSRPLKMPFSHRYAAAQPPDGQLSANYLIRRMSLNNDDPDTQDDDDDDVDVQVTGDRSPPPSPLSHRHRHRSQLSNSICSLNTLQQHDTVTGGHRKSHRRRHRHHHRHRQSDDLPPRPHPDSGVGTSSGDATGSGERSREAAGRALLTHNRNGLAKAYSVLSDQLSESRSRLSQLSDSFR